MEASLFHQAGLITPAYVYDQGKITAVLERLGESRKKIACKVLYSIKSANVMGLLEFIQPYVDGFSCSSLFELQLAKKILDEDQSTHITAPGYRNDEWGALGRLSDYLTLNSVSQWQRMAEQISKETHCGIRFNPELSYAEDERYDPCRPYSKLGITLAQLDRAIKEARIDWQYIEGVHIHNNCASTELEQLKQSIKKTMAGLSGYQADLKWINLGGGYLFNDETDIKPLEDTVNGLKEKFNVAVFIEPGRAITERAGYLVSTVIDLIEHKDKKIAVLDTSINHLPEVFEYQYQPAVMNAKGVHEYQLAGCSCLSGDLFGDYGFDEPLKPGSQLIFENTGAYMQVKANRFNGINLPVTYLYDRETGFKLIKQQGYEAFINC